MTTRDNNVDKIQKGKRLFDEKFYRAAKRSKKRVTPEELKSEFDLIAIKIMLDVDKLDQKGEEGERQ